MDFEQELKRVADSYAGQGYKIFLRPKNEDLPGFAQDFTIEILARRGDEGVLVAVKRDRDELAADPNLTRYAEITGSQKRWRFDLATLEPERRGVRDFDGAEDFSEADIKRTFADARKLLDKGFLNPAVITAWSGFESAMRHRLRAVGERAGWGSSPRSMLNELFSNGLLSQDEFKKLETLYRVRNQIVHGFLSPLASEGGAVQFLTDLGHRLIPESQKPTPLPTGLAD